MDSNKYDICTTYDKESEKLKRDANQAASLLACISHQMTKEEMKKIIEIKENIYKRIIGTKEGEYL